KARWMLDNVPGARGDASAGRLALGTIDSWLIWNLTGGREHAIDYTNASRTMLLDIHNQRWDAGLLEMLGVPEAVLPRLAGSSQVIGKTDPAVTGGMAIPISGVAGDQQAALFGQRAWSAGEAKNTYGTGAFLLMNLGRRPADPAALQR